MANTPANFEEALEKVNKVLTDYGLGGVVTLFDYRGNVITFQMPKECSIQFVANGVVEVTSTTEDQLNKDLGLLASIPEFLQLNVDLGEQLFKNIYESIADVCDDDADPRLN